MILQKKEREREREKSCDEETCSVSAMVGRRLQRHVAEAEPAMGEGAWRTLWRESRRAGGHVSGGGSLSRGRTAEEETGGDRGEVTLPWRVAATGELQVAVAAAAACRRQSLI